MSGFVKYIKPIDEQTKLDEMNTRLKYYRDSVAFFNKVREILKGWEGKQISKRMTDYVDKNLPEDTWCSLEWGYGSVSLRFYRKRTEPSYSNERFMTIDLGKYEGDKKYTDSRLDSEQKAYDNLKQSGDKLEVGIKAIPMLVAEYNEILAKSQALVVEASKIGMEYEFDLACNAK